MPALSIKLQGDGCWPDLEGKDLLTLSGPDAPSIQLALLPGGMDSGKPSISIRIDLPDGRVLLTETSARLFCTAANMVMAKYPDLFEGD